MSLNGYRFNNKHKSYSIINFSDEVEQVLLDRMPTWVIGDETASCEEFRNLEDVINSIDELLIVGIDTSEIKNWAFLEDIAALSYASCKIILCKNSNRFKKIKGYDAVITTDIQISDALNDLVWGIISPIYNGINGIDEAAFYSIISCSKKGVLRARSCSSSIKGWNGFLHFVKNSFATKIKPQKIEAIYASFSLPKKWYKLKNQSDLVKLYESLIPKVVNRVIVSSVAQDNPRLIQEDLLEIIMTS